MDGVVILISKGTYIYIHTVHTKTPHTEGIHTANCGPSISVLSEAEGRDRDGHAVLLLLLHDYCRS